MEVRNHISANNTSFGAFIKPKDVEGFARKMRLVGDTVGDRTRRKAFKMIEKELEECKYYDLTYSSFMDPRQKDFLILSKATKEPVRVFINTDSKLSDFRDPLDIAKREVEKESRRFFKFGKLRRILTKPYYILKAYRHEIKATKLMEENPKSALPKVFREVVAAVKAMDKEEVVKREAISDLFGV